MNLDSSCFGKEKDEWYMSHAFRQARIAFGKDEVPVGAVLVDANGKIIARAHNQVEKKYTQLAHAECLALQKAGKKISNWRLEGCWLYVTLEPCAMCMYAIMLSRLEGVIFGASSPLFGYQLDKELTLSVYKNDTLSVVSGVKRQEAADLLKDFFVQKRKRKDNDSKTNNRESKRSTPQSPTRA